MHLTQKDIELFYKLWYALTWGINEMQGVIPRFEKPVYGTRINVLMEDFAKIRDKMWDSPNLIDDFLKENDNGELSEQERAIIMSWRNHYIRDRFVIMRHLKNYSVFMRISEDEPAKLYGVTGISDSFKDMCREQTHILVEIVLIPFGDRIIYDSLLAPYDVSFGSSIRKTFNDDYKESKTKFGIITNLGEQK